MEKISKGDEQKARTFASPIILRILKNFSVEDVEYAIENDIGIVDWLKANSQAFMSLRRILQMVPFLDDALLCIGEPRWIKWFVNNELQHEMPSLYMLFAYNPKAFPWLEKYLKELAEFL